MTKAIFLSYTGVVLPRKGSEYREFIDTLVKSSNLKDSDKAHEWFMNRVREAKKRCFLEEYMNEDDLLRSVFEKGRDEIRLTYPVEKLLILCKNCLMYGPVSDEILNFFTLAGKPIYIITDCAADYALIEMKRNRLHAHGVIGCDGAKSYRSHAEAFEYVLAKTGYKKDEVLYVGEDPYMDMIGAQLAGIPAVLLDRRGNYHNAECKRSRSLAALLVNLGD